MSWRKYKLGDLLKRVKEPVKIKPGDEYSLVTIRMYHKGVVKRAEVKGSSIKSPILYSVKPDQFILSGIDARNRAFGIVPPELNGAIVTNDFWTHDINSKLISLKYFYWFTTTPQFYEACIKASEGTTNRQRLQADKFYSFDVWLPSLQEQKVWVRKIYEINRLNELLGEELTNQQTHLQQLRQAILQEAVQGKLTKQNKDDEPADKLLQRIKTEKQKLIAAGKLKKEKEFSGLAQNKFKFDLPPGWIACRLGDICYLITDGTHHTPKYVSDGVPFLSVKNLSQGILDFSDTKFITQKEHNELIKRCKPELGDILLTKVGTTGIAKVVDTDRAFSIFVSVALLKFDQELIFNRFLEVLINSPIVKKQSEEGTEGIGNKNLVLKKINSFLIPLPPLSEQHRIVAKVEQLMQMVNELEKQVEQSQAQTAQLLQAVLKEAFNNKGKEYEMNDVVTMAAEE